jgi:hypothetical protein
VTAAFRRVAAIASLVFLACPALAAQVEAARDADLPIVLFPTIRFTSGLQITVPGGWSWEYVGGHLTRLIHLATAREVDGRRRGPNDLIVSSRATAAPVLDDPFLWSDVRQASRELSNGAAAQYKVGKHLEEPKFHGVIRKAGAGAFLEVFTDQERANFDVGLVESTFIKIGETLRVVESSNRIYHPRLSYSTAMPPASPPGVVGGWSVEVHEHATYYFYRNHGTERRAMVSVIPPAKSFSHVDEAHAAIARFYLDTLNVPPGGLPFGKHFADGELRWTEQPGTAAPFIGALLRRGRTHYVSVTRVAGAPLPSNDEIRGAFLAIAESIQDWDARLDNR